MCHQEPHYKIGYGQGTHGYSSQYHHKPELCHFESHVKCMKEHKNICHYGTVNVPHKEPLKVPETICHYTKHHSYRPKAPVNAPAPTKAPTYTSASTEAPTSAPSYVPASTNALTPTQTPAPTYNPTPSPASNDFK